MKYKRINETSKKAQAWKRAYDTHAHCTTLDDCYRKYNTARHNAYTFCVSEMCAEGGWGKRIINHNSIQFTFAYQCWDNDNNIVLRIITRNNNYEILWNPF